MEAFTFPKRIVLNIGWPTIQASLARDGQRCAWKCVVALAVTAKLDDLELGQAFTVRVHPCIDDETSLPVASDSEVVIYLLDNKVFSRSRKVVYCMSKRLNEQAIRFDDTGSFEPGKYTITLVEEHRHED